MHRAAGQVIDSPGLGKCQREGTGQEVVTPIQIDVIAVWKRFAQGFNKAHYQGIEVSCHEFATPFGRVIDLRYQLKIMLPLLMLVSQ